VTKRIPKTLHLLVHSKGGGTETNVQNLVRAVPEFSMLAIEDDLGGIKSPTKLFRAIRELRKTNPEVVFCYGITAHVLAEMAWPVGKPLVGNIRCESDFVGKKQVIRSLIKRRFRYWVSNSKMGLRGEKGIVIYNGVEPPGEEKPLFKDLPSPVFGILARGHPKKRHDFAIKLWKKLGKPGSMIFAGTLPDNLRIAAEKESIICPGFVEPGPLLQSLDLLLSPSDAEGIPTSIFEAMIRGVPSLSTPVGGIPEILKHEKNGYLLERKDWEEFLENLNLEEIRNTGERAREFSEQKLTFDRMKTQFIRVAQKAAN